MGDGIARLGRAVGDAEGVAGGRASRMTASQRRAQLVQVGKQVFAELGYDGASMEEIAHRAKVSKPVIYEHFGGKEGLYAVVVDRESTRLLELITVRLDPAVGPKQMLMSSAMAFLDYIEDDPDGFRVLTRDSPSGFGGGMAGLLSDVATKAEEVLATFFDKSDIPLSSAELYARALVGMVVYAGSWWAEVRQPSKEVVAAHLMTLAYHGLGGVVPDPVTLVPRRRKAG